MKRNFATFFLVILVLTGYSVFIVSPPLPTGRYSPETIRDPECALGDVDCIVKTSNTK